MVFGVLGAPLSSFVVVVQKTRRHHLILWLAPILNGSGRGLCGYCFFLHKLVFGQCLVFFMYYRVTFLLTT